MINVGKKQWKSTQKDFIFVSYLFNMINHNKNNFLYSSYWGNLPENLLINNKSSSWFHIFVKDDFIDTPRKAAKYINHLNSKSNKIQQNEIVENNDIPSLEDKVEVKTISRQEALNSSERITFEFSLSRFGS